jgi:malonate decarboxylase acyl carrier protein
LEILTFEFPGGRQRLRREVQVGVVASGNLEVLLGRNDDGPSTARVRTSVAGFRETWFALLTRFFERYDISASIEINDAGASPPVVQLRLEQALEEALK